MADNKKKKFINIKQKSEIQKSKGSWVDFFRLDESYTSLLLGIIVVIIASVLLVSFVKNKNTQSLHKEITSISIAPTASVHNLPLTISPTSEPETVTPSVSIPVSTVTIKAPTITPTPIISKRKLFKPESAQSPTTPSQMKGTKSGGTYTVKSGDNLWAIAEQTYGSGYNWVDIASYNHLTNPSVLYSGTVLHLPNVTPKLATTVEQQTITNISSVQYGLKITSDTYTVQKGDSLWTISQRAYNGDGSQWTKIASANHLANPRLIFSGNVFIIPRN